MVAIITHANDRDGAILDQGDQLLHSTAILVSGHAIHLVHNEDVLARDRLPLAAKEAGEGFVAQKGGNFFL